MRNDTTSPLKFMRLPNIFDTTTEDKVTPSFSPKLYDFNDPNRPLTTQEVK